MGDCIGHGWNGALSSLAHASIFKEKLNHS